MGEERLEGGEAKGDREVDGNKGMRERGSRLPFGAGELKRHGRICHADDEEYWYESFVNS